ncbi:Sorbose reductase sou1 [Psilocybe cubensis]|uniref:Sorbose reductase sou1 n=2 Tax=Psilocybe cubensis TaxID=181762 RepID=A0ACB8GT86_PSICU|nr:Sorbose reductase sou1 [Psilocybe cubensis]KAH9478794.1 Sorbose reductase sou1 [Psilocybe cubensis]
MSDSSHPLGVAAALATEAPPVRTALNLFSLLGKVAIVTGGHRGIGLEIALALVEVGAIVYCLDLSNEPNEEWLKVQKFASELGDLVSEGKIKKGRLEYMPCDVTNQKEMWTLVDKIASQEGRLDICFANAGIAGFTGILEYPEEDFQKVLDVNVNGAFYTAQAAAREMVKRQIAGSIILTSSICGSVALPRVKTVAYNISKASVLQMGRSMACELGENNIRVNTISPGYIFTATDELRGAALFLASDASTFCTGSNLTVDGGHCAW